MPWRTPTILRCIAILFFAFSLPFFVPIISPLAGSTSSIVPMTVLFSFLVGFLVNRALERKQTISTSVAVELTRLRRLRHMSENSSETSWKKRFAAALKAYQKGIVIHCLIPEETLVVFRSFSHLVYGYQAQDRREEMILSDMFQSLREIALERQRRGSAFHARISWYGWLVISIFGLLIISLLLSNRSMTGFTPWGVGAAVAGILFVLDLLYRLDQFSLEEIGYFRALYQKQM